MKPFSTYPEDRKELLALASLILDADEPVSADEWSGAVKLADMVKAILEDEEVGLKTLDEVVALLLKAYTTLAFAFNRIHVLPRSRDSELASDIAKVRGEIEPILKFFDKNVEAKRSTER